MLKTTLRSRNRPDLENQEPNQRTKNRGRNKIVVDEATSPCSGCRFGTRSLVHYHNSEVILPVILSRSRQGLFHRLEMCFRGAERLLR